MQTIDDRKQAQRRAALETRNGLSPAEAAEMAAQNFCDAIAVTSSMVVSVYLPIGSEIRTGPLFRKLEAIGATCALPVILKQDQALIFRAFSCGDPLEAGGFGTRVPLANRGELLPDIVVTPLLAFDEQGFRMGYGGGFYDRTLEKLRQLKTCIAIGYAYEGQRVEEVVTDQHDQRLDCVITEEKVRKFT
ncbi:5-formyltetrahydrofolate cyclo-ligase [Sneathiella glossodoripedis]|uniref:5-formyltetrahydrofolate cyclo-ligase n=1 Tax=Sneathiella glossodoripedis TaxID=418853 RepID=UPI0005601448|nr:5-formyltetrahydrofolate cyclo-ligase [Sneathiella glossodoripedis]